MKYLTRQNDLPNVYAWLNKCAQMCVIELVKEKSVGEKTRCEHRNETKMDGMTK